MEKIPQCQWCWMTTGGNKKPGYPKPTVSALVADLDNIKTVEEQEKNPKQKELKNFCVDALCNLSHQHSEQQDPKEFTWRLPVFCRLHNTTAMLLFCGHLGIRSLV